MTTFYDLFFRYSVRSCLIASLSVFRDLRFKCFDGCSVLMNNDDDITRCILIKDGYCNENCGVEEIDHKNTIKKGKLGQV